MARATEWEKPIIEGWVQAATIHPDPEWAEELLAYFPERSELLDSLAPERRKDYLLTELKNHPINAMKTLCHYQQPWGAEITRSAALHLRDMYQANDRAFYSGTQRSFYISMAMCMDPFAVADLPGKFTGKADSGSEWARILVRMQDLLDHRKKMMEEFH